MIILASGSPRRKELLSSLGYKYTIISSDVDETPTKSEPSEIVMELSARKGLDVCDKVIKNGKADLTKGTLIIAADTLVFKDNHRMGKPASTEDAAFMLNELSGAEHEVLTGVTLVYIKHGLERIVKSFYESSKVSFYDMSETEISEYIATKEPMDKAGAYAIQGIGGKYVRSISGEYSNVVGLPIARLYHELKLLNVTF